MICKSCFTMQPITRLLFWCGGVEWCPWRWQRDSMQQPAASEREGAKTLLVLAEVIPGEDRGSAGRFFRNMTSEVVHAMQRPLHQRPAALEEISEMQGVGLAASDSEGLWWATAADTS